MVIPSLSFQPQARRPARQAGWPGPARAATSTARPGWATAWTCSFHR